MLLLSNSACQNHVRNKDPASLCLYLLVHVNMLFNFSQYIPGLALSASYNVADFCWQMYFYYTFYINIYSTWHVPVLVCYNFFVHPCFNILSIWFCTCSWTFNFELCKNCGPLASSRQKKIWVPLRIDWKLQSLTYVMTMIVICVVSFFLVYKHIKEHKEQNLYKETSLLSHVLMLSYSLKW